MARALPPNGGREGHLQAAALTAERLQNIDAVIDFTSPQAVLGNIEACVGAGKNMVVAEWTGWYGWCDVERVRKLVEGQRNWFLVAGELLHRHQPAVDAARTAAGILQHQYSGQIFERHHAQKKDAPSGTAVTLQKIIRDAAGKELEIVSFREGDVVGTYEVVLDFTERHDLPLSRFQVAPGIRRGGLCGRPNGWLGKKAFLILGMFGGRPRAKSF